MKKIIILLSLISFASSGCQWTQISWSPVAYEASDEEREGLEDEYWRGYYDRMKDEALDREETDRFFMGEDQDAGSAYWQGYSDRLLDEEVVTYPRL